MNIYETLAVLASVATILDFLWHVGEWVVGHKRERKADEQVQGSQEKK